MVLLSRGLTRRLLVAMTVLIGGYTVFTFMWNVMLYQGIRNDIFSIWLQEISDVGGLEACDADPAVWARPEHRFGAMVAMDPSGKVYNADAPQPRGRPPSVAPGEIKTWKGGAPGTWWTAVHRVEREGTCQYFLIYQTKLLGLAPVQYAATVAARLSTGAVLLLAAWAFVIGPLVGRIRRHADDTRRIVEADFSGELTVESEDELGALVGAFNSATTAARERLDLLTKRDALTREFLANVAHDVRTPLASLKLGVGRLLEQQPDSEVGTTVLSEILYMEALLSNMSQMVKLEGTSLPLALREVDARDVVLRIVARFRMVAGVRGVALHDAVPDEALMLVADAVSLEQAVSNLVQNAVDFASGNVAILCFEEQGEVVFQVRDDGPGLDLAEIPKLSERRYQGETSRTRGRKGQGLGLAIADEVARRHGGSLRLGTHPEGGTVGTVRMPINATG